MRLNDVNQIFESISDRGIFKAVFVGGIPGAGKTSLLRTVIPSEIHPKIINIDKFIEHNAPKRGYDLTQELTPTQMILPKRMIKNQLVNYVNGMLPLVIDGTATHYPVVQRRIQSLNLVGYDTFILWVNTDLNVALARNAQRTRQVDPEVIRDMSANSTESKARLHRSMPSNFYEIDNSGDTPPEEQLSTASKKIRQFFTSPVENPRGQQIIHNLKQTGDKYLTPNIMTLDELHDMLNFWFVKSVNPGDH